VSGVVHPEWLGPAFFTLLGAVLMVALARRLAAARLARLLGGSARLGSPARDAALLVALAAVLAGLVAPRAGERERRVAASGRDLVLLFDVSHSMDASDTPPSRLARARRAADELLAQLAPGDRVALAAFASRGVLLTPLSPDHEALRELLGGLDSELITPRGSALAQGVRAALGAFEAGSERPRVLLVLSDGEDSQRGRDLPLAELVRADVRVLAAAFGSETGALLPDHGVPLVDASGRPVLTRRTLAPLESLAQATAGEVFRADALGALEPGALLRALARDAGREGGFVVRRERAPLVWPFAAIAFAFLLVEALPAPRLPRLRPRVALAALCLCLLALGPLTQQAALRLQQAGLARLERGDSDGAVRAFEAAALVSRDPALAALAYYHLGVAQLTAGRLEHARSAFFDALALAPDDELARFDLEWTLAALKRRPPPAPATAAPSAPREKPPPRPNPVAQRAPAAGEQRPSPQSPAALDADERERLLARLPDDPRRSLRVGARASAGDAAPRSAGPAWCHSDASHARGSLRCCSRLPERAPSRRPPSPRRPAARARAACRRRSIPGSSSSGSSRSCGRRT
jgi:Mg-chelatase subunit ChlD